MTGGRYHGEVKACKEGVKKKDYEKQQQDLKEQRRKTRDRMFKSTEIKQETKP